MPTASSWRRCEVTSDRARGGARLLLRSLDDLEREHDAGDVDDTDYATLRDDYTARAAAVIRSIDARADEAAPVARRAWGRTLGWVAAIMLFAVLAGVLVARMSVSRRDSETATGDVRENTRQLIADATTAAQKQEYDDAIELYSKALELSPSNAEALTYRGWARYRKGGDDTAARTDLDDAIAVDASYPDARVFKAIVLVDQGDFSGASAEMKVFDTLDPPSFMQQIVQQNALREQITAGVLLADGAPGFAEAGFDHDQVMSAAAYLAESKGKPADSITLLDQLLAADAGDADADAHAYKGFVLVRVGDQADNQELIDSGSRDRRRAGHRPQHAPALAYRTFTACSCTTARQAPVSLGVRCPRRQARRAREPGRFDGCAAHQRALQP
jgi:tetratricopeptide (TPR) repeat protein